VANSAPPSCPIPRWRAYSAPPDLLAVFKGPTSKRREGKREERGRGGEEPAPRKIFWPKPLVARGCGVVMGR